MSRGCENVGVLLVVIKECCISVYLGEGASYKAVALLVEVHVIYKSRQIQAIGGFPKSISICH